MKKIIILIIFTFFPIIANAEEVNLTEKYDAKLIKCETANYAYFEVNNKKTFIRLLAFDRMNGNLNDEIDNYVCKRLTEANSIKIEYDTNLSKDIYNRNYAFIYVDDQLLEEDLIKKGYGQVSNITTDYDYLDSLCNVQKDALIKKVGIWNYPNIKEEYCQSGIDLENNNNEKKSELVVQDVHDSSYLKTLLFLNSSIVLIILLYKYKKQGI